ncbi:MAG: hypothetical protein MSA89_06145 [Clostridium sp.]|nr:hypothetical protein [Clostridium sp.]MCI7442651.1 hypothetical protein [Clostridium sp.]
MEINNQKLGGGIMTICILTLIGFVITLFSSITMLTGRDKIVESYKTLGLDTSIIPSTGQTVISLILSILIALSVILILMKKSIGIYGYFIAEIISIIASIIFAGFSILNIVLSLIFPILMAIFISKRKSVFGL